MLGVRYQFREFLIALIVFLISHIFGYLRETTIVYSVFLIISALEEAIRGYWTIEERVKNLARRFKS